MIGEIVSRVESTGQYEIDYALKLVDNRWRILVKPIEKSECDLVNICQLLNGKNKDDFFSVKSFNRFESGAYFLEVAKGDDIEEGVSLVCSIPQNYYEEKVEENKE